MIGIDILRGRRWTVVTDASRREAHGCEESLRGEFYVIQPGSSVQVSDVRSCDVQLVR